MKRLFIGVPIKRVMIDLLLAIIWSAMNAIFADTVGGLIAHSSNDIINLAIRLLVFVVTWEIVEVAADVYGIQTNAIIEANVSKHYFNKLYHIKPQILKDNNTGYISSVLHKLYQTQGSLYRELILYFPINVVYIGYFSYKMYKIDYRLSILIIGIVVFATIYRLGIGVFTKREYAKVSTAENVRNKFISDTVSNIGTVQKMQANEFINNSLDEYNRDTFTTNTRWATYKEIAYCGFKMLIYAHTPLAIFMFEIVVNKPEMREVFYSALAVVSIQLAHTSKAFVAVIDRYDKFIETSNKIENIVKSCNKRGYIHEGDFIRYSLRDVKYSYMYDKESIDISRLITINIPEFSFRKGDKVCIYGESGQGKTTLLHLVSGEIEYGYYEINCIDTTQRLDCVFIAQDTEILDMSLKDNLTLGKEIDDSKIINYLNRVGLGDWFDSQKDGLDTLLGERGVFVSTGQRQRLNLIRGLLFEDKEIYLLDEPTSNVDVETEDSMISLIDEVLKDKTVLIVTHRPKIKAMCNKIYKFENSSIELESYNKRV